MHIYMYVCMYVVYMCRYVKRCKSIVAYICMQNEKFPCETFWNLKYKLRIFGCNLCLVSL